MVLLCYAMLARAVRNAHIGNRLDGLCVCVFVRAEHAPLLGRPDWRIMLYSSISDQRKCARAFGKFEQFSEMRRHGDRNDLIKIRTEKASPSVTSLFLTRILSPDRALSARFSRYRRRSRQLQTLATLVEANALCKGELCLRIHASVYIWIDRARTRTKMVACHSPHNSRHDKPCMHARSHTHARKHMLAGGCLIMQYIIPRI